MESLEVLKISEEKKKYIIETLNPVLEEMAAECIHKSPNDPIDFMLDWLVNKKVNDENRKLTSDEKDKLEQENAALEASIKKVTAEMQETAKIAQEADGEAKEEEEEEQDDDDDEEPPPGWEKSKESMAKCRQSVSAEAYGEWNAKKAFVPPVIVKSDPQKARLSACLSKSFLFQSLEEQDLVLVIGAMKEVKTEKGERVINQGDNGDFLFVIESGKLACSIMLPDKTEKVVKTCEPGDVFGELALLYNCPRAASVQCTEKCVLWQLDRDTFNNIVKEAAQKKRQKYNNFLDNVPLLQSMGTYERSQLADALRSETFTDGCSIVTQGEDGAKFYVLEEGAAVAEKNGQQVMTYGVGDYFGELALIRNQPRAATVKARGVCKVLSLDRSGFKRLIPATTFLKRNDYS